MYWSSRFPPIIGVERDGMEWWHWHCKWSIDEEPIPGVDSNEDGIYIHRDAARAWQALRDWLNGNQYQWYARGYEASHENRRERAKR